MFELSKLTLKRNLSRFLLFTAITVAMTVLLSAIFPSIEDSASELEQLFEYYPTELFNALDVELGSIFMDFESYLAAEYFSMLWQFLLIFLIGAIVNINFVQEQQERVIALLLSQPISRLKIYLTKYLTSLTLVALFVLATLAAIYTTALIADVSSDIEKGLKFGLHALAFGWVIYSFGTMVSVFSTKVKYASGIFSVTAIISYALIIVSNLKDSLSDLRYLSVFNYLEQNSTLIHGQIEWKSLLVMILFAILFTIIGMLRFIRKDFDL